MTHHLDPRLIALLAWYRDMGVTDALAEEPLDWLALGDRAAIALERDAARAIARGVGQQDQSVPPEPPEFRAPSRARSAPNRSFTTVPVAGAEDSARAAAQT